MFKIDIHTHILPLDLNSVTGKFQDSRFLKISPLDAETAWMEKDGKHFRKISCNCWDQHVRSNECRETHVDMQVLSTVPILFSYWAKSAEAYELSQFLNDHISEIARSSPDRFIGLGTVPMQEPQLAVREIERCMRILGMRGIEIGTNINSENLSDPKFRPIFEAAQDMDCAIFVHPWDMMGEDQMRKYWLPWLVGMPAELSRAISSLIFGGVLEQFPDLRIAFAHGGGSYPWTMGRIEHGYNVRPDLCAIDNAHPPSEYNGKIYFDSLVHDADALRFLLNRFGANFIAMGSDYPFPLGEAKPGELIESMDDLSDEVKQRLLAGTALEWLGMESL